jgi:PEGA domain
MRTASKLLVLALLTVPAAHAAEKSSKPAASEKAQRPLAELLTGPALDAYLKGRDLFDAGDVVTGHAKLSEAYELSKNPRLLWNMAACSKSSRNYARAIDELTHFLEDGREVITAEQAKRAEEVRATLYSLVAAATLQVTPAGAKVTLDGEPASRGAGPYYLELGKHELRVELEGYKAETRTLEVKQTKPFTVEVALREDAPALAVQPALPLAPAAASTPAPAAATAPVAPVSEPDRTWAYVTLGVGAAGVAAGSAFGLLALGEKNDLDALCKNGVCQPSAQSILDSANRWATLSTASWVVGGLALAGGAYLYFAPPGERAPTTALRVTPATVSFEGSF